MKKRNIQGWITAMALQAVRNRATGFRLNVTMLFWDAELRPGFSFWDEMAIFCWCTGCSYRMERNGEEDYAAVTLPRSIL